MKAFAALLLAAALAACGGPSSYTPGPAGPYRAASTVYFAGCITSAPLVAQLGAVGYWAVGRPEWCGGTRSPAWFMDVAKEALAARTAGIDYLTVQLPPEIYFDDTETEFQLSHLAASGALRGFKGIRVAAIDEPNIATAEHRVITDAEVTAKNAALKAMFARIPGLEAARVRTVYSCNGVWPGVHSTDSAGCDNYDIGCNVLLAGGHYEELYGLLTGDQEFFTVIGGSSPWKTAPDCFVAWASTHPRVAEHVFFRYENTYSATGALLYEGIATNGMKRAFCEVSWAVKVPGGVAICP